MDALTLISPRHVLAAANRLQRSGLVFRTPLEKSLSLSAVTSAHVYHKLETWQPTGSFKVRGAANKLLRMRDEDAGAFRRGFVAASAGNHGLGLAHASTSLGARSTLVVPRTVSPAKLESLWRYPIELVVSVGNYDVAEADARKMAHDRGTNFLSPYNDADVIAGAGTIGLEILADLPDVDIVLVPVGGGGLAAGIAVYLKAIAPRTRVIGVQSEAYPGMKRSLAAGEIVQVEDLPSLADGLAGNIEAGSMTFDLCRHYLDDMILVSESDIEDAMRHFLKEERLVVEGSGAVCAAALLAGKVDLAVAGVSQARVVSLATGRNVAEKVLRDLLAKPVEGTNS
ncbi:MAG TPA: threonine/serine dehydratase [Polyangium sp.]|nr:threonine/serine dehydratase [Polyangium sp.]